MPGAQFACASLAGLRRLFPELCRSREELFDLAKSGNTDRSDVRRRCSSCPARTRAAACSSAIIRSASRIRSRRGAAVTAAPASARWL